MSIGYVKKTSNSSLMHLDLYNLGDYLRETEPGKKTEHTRVQKLVNMFVIKFQYTV